MSSSKTWPVWWKNRTDVPAPFLSHLHAPGPPSLTAQWDPSRRIHGSHPGTRWDPAVEMCTGACPGAPHWCCHPCSRHENGPKTQWLNWHEKCPWTAFSLWLKKKKGTRQIKMRVNLLNIPNGWRLWRWRPLSCCKKGQYAFLCFLKDAYLEQQSV